MRLAPHLPVLACLLSTLLVFAAGIPSFGREGHGGIVNIVVRETSPETATATTGGHNSERHNERNEPYDWDIEFDINDKYEYPDLHSCANTKCIGTFAK
ncbi:hypothetical protein ATERTT37_002323 [Aspergillus terreus]